MVKSERGRDDSLPEAGADSLPEVGADSLPEVGAERVYERLSPAVWILGGAMVLVGLVTTYLILQDFSSQSYIYLAFYSIPANTAISFFPHEPVLIYFGKFANLWLAAGAATVGTIVAGLMDHSVFVPVLNHRAVISYKGKRFYRRTVDTFMRYPFATLVVAGFTPIPFFPFKFLSFSIHYPLRRYLTALVVARYPRYFLLAWLGAATDIPNWVLFGAFLIVINLYFIKAVPLLAKRLRMFASRRKERRVSPTLPEQTGAEPAEAGP